MKGTLYLIPADLGGDDLSKILPPEHAAVINRLDHFIVENIRSARRFLKRAGLARAIDDLTFYELNKHTAPEMLPEMVAPLKSGMDVGLLSEAGLPCIADPGAIIVEMVQRAGGVVYPMVGPSSLLLALMGSGLNGQRFSFGGYVPKDKGDRQRWLKDAAHRARKFGETQLFMDTPFRNDKLLEELSSILPSEILICVAANLTMPSQYIRTRTAATWKKNRPSLHKKPVMFVMGYQLGHAT